jgi:hypothetical protein
VSAWSSWTPCSSSCGPGTSSRTRTVTRPESNGGVSCPDLHQDKKCRGEGGCTRRKEEPKLITHKKHGASALRGRRGLVLQKLSSSGFYRDSHDPSGQVQSADRGGGRGEV